MHSIASRLLVAIGLAAAIAPAGPAAAVAQEAPAPRAWFGAVCTAPDEGPGVNLDRVLPGSPAEQAGLANDTIVLTVNGAAPASPEEFVAIIGASRPGGSLELGLRDGRMVTVVLGERPRELDDPGYLGRMMLGRVIEQRTLVDAVSGDAVALLDSSAEFVVFDFWATWCGPCLAMEPAMRALHAEVGDRVRIVSVSDEAPEALARHHGASPLAWPSVSDPEGAFAMSLWITSLPTWVVTDGTGRVVFVAQGAHEFAAMVRHVGGTPP